MQSLSADASALANSVNALIAIAAILLLAVLVCAVFWRLRPGVSHGSAGFGHWPGATAASLAELPPGLVMGRTEKGQLAGWSDEGHWLAVAPTGAGKSTGLLMPSIACWRGSLVAVDIKGELAKACFPALRDAGVKCARIDPFGLLDGVAGLPAVGINPILEAKSAPDFGEAIKAVAASIVTASTGKDVHWSGSAQMLAAALAAITSESRKDPSLARISTMIKSGHSAIKEMSARQWPEAVDNLFKPAAKLVSEAGANERGAIYSTLRRELGFLDNPKIAETLRGSWSPGELVDPKKAAALFIILPPEHLVSQASFLRVIIGCVVQAMLAAGTSRERRLLFALDEAATLGNLQAVSGGVSLFRGYGATFLLSFQNLAQLAATYGEQNTQSILANCHHLYWSCRDAETCAALSRQLGDMTVLSAGRSAEAAPLAGDGASMVREVGRPLLTAEEIRRLPTDQITALVGGHRPVKLKLLPPGSHEFS